MKEDGVFKYIISDHLGSVSMVLSPDGDDPDNEIDIEGQRYLPFGEPRTMAPYADVTSTDFTYTGQRALPDTGLMDYNARFYSPSLKRFIQPDTIIPGATYSQTWNRYSYVLNNPINASDPSGHKCEGEVEECQIYTEPPSNPGDDETCTSPWPWYCSNDPQDPEDPESKLKDSTSGTSGETSDTWCGEDWCSGDIFLYRYDKPIDARVISWSWAMGLGTFFFVAGGFDVVWTDQGVVVFLEEPAYLDPVRPSMPRSSSSHNSFIPALLGESLTYGYITSVDIRRNPSKKGIRDAWSGLAMQEGGSGGWLLALNSSSSADVTGNPDFQTTATMIGAGYGIPEIHQYLTNAVPYREFDR